MATQEARLLLAELMGADRNAPLPPGMARPSSKANKKKREQEYLRHANLKKIRKSCYDPDIDPLFTAWGIDVYDLFVNTKSDLGANPYVVDNAAHEEYLQLSSAEKEKLGFDYFLFQKLSELVRSADRTIARNEEKLKIELQRKRSAGRAENLFVEEVDDHALEALCRALVMVELLENEMSDKLERLGEVSDKEAIGKSELEGLLERKKYHMQQKQKEAEGEKEEQEKAVIVETVTSASGAAADADDAKPEEATTPSSTDPDAEGGGAAVPAADDNPAEPVKSDNLVVPVVVPEPLTDEEEQRLQSLQLELGRHTLERQVLLHRIAELTRRLVPLYDDTHSHRRHLLTVRNDITTDKTVCHVSGNFLSARDADERIAAHYAGKQYQGWRLVRDKLKELQRIYGRHGPPPPAAGARGGPPPPPRGSFTSSSSGPPPRGGGGGYGGRSGGDRDRDRGGPPPPPGRYDDSRYGGGGGGGYGGGGPPPRGCGGRDGRWERHGPLPPPSSQSYGGDSGGGYYSRSGGGSGSSSWRR